MASDANAHVTLPGKVEKIIPAVYDDPEKAQICLDKCDEFYEKVRIENKLTDKDGNEVALKPGAKVEVTVDADKTAVTKKTEGQ